MLSRLTKISTGEGYHGFVENGFLASGKNRIEIDIFVYDIDINKFFYFLFYR